MADQSGRFVHAKKAGYPFGYPASFAGVRRRRPVELLRCWGLAARWFVEVGTRVGAYCIRPTGRAPRARMDVPPRPYSTASGTRPTQGFALGYDPAPLQGARVPGAARRAASTNQRAARPQQTNNSTGRLRTPAKLAGYPKGCPAFFACTNLPLRPAITIRSYRYIPFNIFFESTEKRTIFVANFHVRCR